MPIRNAKAAASAGLFLMFLLHCSDLSAQLEEPEPTAAVQVRFPYYVSKGRRFALVESQRYGAFRIANDSEMSEFEDEVTGLDSMIVDKLGSLNQRGIALVRRNDPATDEDFSEDLEGLQARYVSIPIYRSGNTDVILQNEFIVRFLDNVSAQRADEILGSIEARDLGTGRRSRNQYVIEFPGKELLQALAAVNALAEADGAVYARPNFIRISPRRLLFRDTGSNSRESLLPVEKIAVYDWPNDDHYADQWGLRKINADDAWQSTIGGCNARIAIIDGGIDLDHEDLKDKITQKFNILDNAAEPVPADPEDTHGTNSAGVAAAVTNNEETGVAGVAWGGEIMVVRVFDGSVLSEVTDDLVLQDGMDAAVAAGATVISNGWGYWFESDNEDEANSQESISPEGMENVEDAIKDAIDHDVVMVFAVGNKADCGDIVECEQHVLWPANLSVDLPIIAVGATDGFDSLLGTSRYTPNGEEVTLVAPGAYIYTTNVTGASAGTYTDYFEATSAATPMVAGAAALVLSWRPGADPTEVRDWLVAGAWQPPDDTKSIEGYGKGRLDIANTLALIGTAGIDLLASLGSEARLAYGEETTIDATLTRDGEPLGGASVRFRSLQPGLVTVSPADSYVATNCSGQTGARVTGATFLPFPKTTQIEVQAAGMSVTVDVKVGGLSWLEWLALLATLLIIASIAVRRAKP